MAQKSPLARVKEEFGGKDKLVDTIVGLLGSGDEPKEDMRRRLLGAANSKLVRLHGVATKVKDVGGRDQLATAAAQELGRAKDKDYVVKLGSFSSGRLLDILESARRRNQRTAKAKAKPGQSVRPASTPGSAAAAPAATAAGATTAARSAKRAPATKAPASSTAAKAKTTGGKKKA